MSDPELPASPEDERARRLTRLEKVTALYGDPFAVARFVKTHGAEAVKTQFEGLAAGEKTDRSVRVAGRVMAIRNNGMFLDLLDDTDRLQVFHDLKSACPERLELLKEE